MGRSTSLLLAAWIIGLLSIVAGRLPLAVAAQEAGPQGAEADGFVDPEAAGAVAEREPSASASDDLNLLSLLFQGGAFMIPLVALSIVVVTITVERAVAIRRPNILPPQMVRELGELGRGSGGFDPRSAYRICQQFPSAAGRVIQSMLTKVGRPQSEVEHTVSEASQREAEKLHGNVRWLSLSAQVAPLIGLLGTVWGMIQAFYDTTRLAPGQNKSEALAEGIYIALVTTLAGLIVAIPAAIAAHWFEGRIIRLFHQIDELVFSLYPQVERFEGKVRFSRQED